MPSEINPKACGTDSAENSFSESLSGDKPGNFA
jgi:hypothetical protein